MDVFSCKEFDAERAIGYSVDDFEAKKYTKNIMKRGLDFQRKVVLSYV